MTVQARRAFLKRRCKRIMRQGCRQRRRNFTQAMLRHAPRPATRTPPPSSSLRAAPQRLLSIAPALKAVPSRLVAPVLDLTLSTTLTLPSLLPRKFSLAPRYEAFENYTAAARPEAVRSISEASSGLSFHLVAAVAALMRTPIILCSSAHGTVLAMQEEADAQTTTTSTDAALAIAPTPESVVPEANKSKVVPEPFKETTPMGWYEYLKVFRMHSRK